MALSKLVNKSGGAGEWILTRNNYRKAGLHLFTGTQHTTKTR